MSKYFVAHQNFEKYFTAHQYMPRFFLGINDLLNETNVIKM